MAYPNSGGSYPSATNTASYGNVTALIASLPQRQQGEVIDASHMNLVQREVIEVEQALGTHTDLLSNPNGGSAYGDLALKLDGMYADAQAALSGHNATSVSVHGLSSGDGSVVGTSATQTLYNKTLSAPTVNGGTVNATSLTVNNVSVVDVSTSQSLSNKTLVSPTITGSGTIFANTATVGTLNVSGQLLLAGKQVLVSGGVDNSVISGATLKDGTVTGGTVDAASLSKGGLTVATLTGTETLTNKTLSNPTLSGTVSGNFTFGGTVSFSNPSVAGAVPTATIIMWYGAAGSIPSGWLECDGSSKAQADYPSLAAAFGVNSGNFTLPDFGGMYPRGTRTAANVGNTGGSTTVTLSPANLPPHSHSMSHDHVVSVSRDYEGNGWSNEATANAALPTPGHSHTGYYRSDFAGGGAGNWDVMRPQSGGGYANEGNKPNHPDMVAGTGAHYHRVDITGQSATHTGNGPGSGAAITGVAPPYVFVRFLIKT